MLMPTMVDTMVYDTLDLDLDMLESPGLDMVLDTDPMLLPTMVATTVESMLLARDLLMLSPRLMLMPTMVDTTVLDTLLLDTPTLDMLDMLDMLPPPILPDPTLSLPTDTDLTVLLMSTLLARGLPMLRLMLMPTTVDTMVDTPPLDTPTLDTPTLDMLDMLPLPTVMPDPTLSLPTDTELTDMVDMPTRFRIPANLNYQQSLTKRSAFKQSHHSKNRFEVPINVDQPLNYSVPSDL